MYNSKHSYWVNGEACNMDFLSRAADYIKYLNLRVLEGSVR